MKYKGRTLIFAFLAGMLSMGLLVAVVAYIPNATTTMTTKEKAVEPFHPVWHENQRIIKHALGGIDGKAGTNTITALQENYVHGSRLFEVDLNMTSDGVLVLHHDWEESGNHYLAFEEEIPTYEAFKRNYKYYKYPTSDLTDLLNYMDTHVDAMFVVDTKYTDEISFDMMIAAMVNQASKLDKMDVLDRMIIQFYNEEQYLAIKNIHPFKHYMYSLYKEKNKDFERVASFCVEHNIETVLMKHTWVQTSEDLLPFNNQGLKVYLYTTNQLSLIYEKEELGAYGFVSDHLNEKDLQLKKYIDYQYKEKIQP
ncbi:glycerophosphoryl diester phosphodiesterase [Breznakia blatticola]|uniref:Glycerophosphoryl diester phosphodiesterase n=1 Tax=Breznakia blatticola TaxID=1754012 RepID=A0A4R7ZKC1_9FIRM|nr:glycerophosphodiester phosphodiesterase family protein [Breznakia blatticola]TDW16961.1 glycerophosphoryl diester phosphodiesterase [Breznakia blatticola]